MKARRLSVFIVFIHFVENIFKHGVINQKENPAKISISISETEIIIETKNKISTSEKYNNSGIGMENLKRRLSAIYQDNYELHYEQIDDRFTTFLKLPIKSSL